MLALQVASSAGMSCAQPASSGGGCSGSKGAAQQCTLGWARTEQTQPRQAQPSTPAGGGALRDEGHLAVQGGLPVHDRPPAVVPGLVRLGVLAQRALRQRQLLPAVLRAQVAGAL